MMQCLTAENVAKNPEGKEYAPQILGVWWQWLNKPSIFFCHSSAIREDFLESLRQHMLMGEVDICSSIWLASFHLFICFVQCEVLFTFLISSYYKLILA